MIRLPPGRVPARRPAVRKGRQMMFPRRLALLVVLLAGLLGAGTANAAAPAHNDVDAEFAAMMIPHHYQAILMSQLAPERASDPALKSLADRIRTEQGLEIKMLQGWQGRNALPVTDAPTAYEEMLGMPEMIEHMGMATREEMEQLATLSGPDFDRMFLDLMIPHHEGAVGMLQHVILHGSDQDLNQMAQDMMSGQKAQLAIMREMQSA
ncbi:Uncharacterized conserved protein, DUF305 family [Saccharopolyspora kobensis]|uniref:Uncharacterized conserved protein, DUF305 family n=2 Tax=Saccharopolyspora kobensis TaxID=146035 RepID=A0A1H6CVI1_9PSEU|nr:Uncharacterized conserved protein, DUF305 family [Saccharopolyspora kobensis]SFD00581.1 Uncharacterized conserved protein, DUF305 family [Saccharopolyspora kobensis]